MAKVMKEVAALLGVELGEQFRIKWHGNICEDKFAFREDGFYNVDREEKLVIKSWLTALLTGEAEIIKLYDLPWRPAVGETCYCLACGTIDTIDENGDGWYVTAFTWEGDIADVSLFAMGNCFPTEEDLLVYEDEIIERYIDAWRSNNENENK